MPTPILEEPLLEDVLHEALRELSRRGQEYVARLADSLAPGLRPAAGKVLLDLEAHGPAHVKEIAARMGLDSTTVSRHVDELVAAEMVRREPDPRDGRAVTVRLSASATQGLAVSDRHRRVQIREVLDDWSAQERTTFAELLARFVRRADLEAEVARLATNPTTAESVSHR